MSHTHAHAYTRCTCLGCLLLPANMPERVAVMGLNLSACFVVVHVIDMLVDECDQSRQVLGSLVALGLHTQR